jgi:hypothetical protein
MNQRKDRAFAVDPIARCDAVILIVSGWHVFGPVYAAGGRDRPSAGMTSLAMSSIERSL